MFDKLIDFVLNLKDEVIPVKIVNEWEGGIHMRAGKFLKSTQPGLNFKIPFIDQFWVVHTVPQTVDLLSQTLTTKDGKNIVLKGIIRYKIEDPKKYLISVNSARDVLVDTVQGVIKNVIEDFTWGDATKLDTLITEKSKVMVEDWGIKVEQVTLVDFSLIKTYRLIQN
jgi:regulator of protease activity HflC (stomatin/prohibitin superfamily)